MDKNNIIFRFNHEHTKEQWLKVLKKTTTIHHNGKRWANHGSLVDTEMAGNGYHGRCEHCGLELVTDLGYNSWSGTKCEIQPYDEVKTTIKLIWSNNEKYATKLTKIESLNLQSDLMNEQGWGTYCFLIREIKQK